MNPIIVGVVHKLGVQSGVSGGGGGGIGGAFLRSRPDAILGSDGEALLRGGAPNSELLMAKSIADLRAIAARHGISLLAAEGDLRETSALSAEAALAGALLLQTRPEPTTLAYSVLPIAPVPGELWLFPLHVTHAVMPRAMPSPEGTPGPLGGSLRPSPPPGGHLRISVACNIYEHEAQGAESEAQR